MGDAPDKLLAGLTSAQHAAVTSEAPLLCVVAGAGSGKTTVLTRRVAWRVASGTAEPEHTLVVTFTRKAAVELRGRLARLGAGTVRAGTFHATAFAQLRRHWADSGVRAPVLAADPTRLLREVLRDAGVGEELLDAVAAEATWASARMVAPDDYPAEATAARRSPGLPAEQVARLLAAHHAEKRKRGVLDLDDLVVECTRVLEAGGPGAAALRWQLRHIFVDEFQDVNPAQWRLLAAWRAGRDDLCVVGDPRQAIYAWNGSDPTLLTRLPSLLPGTVVLSLDENHRSSEHIVKAAASVLRAGTAEDTADDAPGLPVASGVVEGPLPVVHGFDDEASEADAVVRWLRATRRPGRPWHRHAVLARTNARLEAVAEGLRRAGIPCRRASGGRQSPTVQRVLRLLRDGDRGAPLRAALVEARAELPELETTGEGASSEVTELFARLADEYAGEDPVPTVGGFLAWLRANRGDSELAGAGDGVELATFHAAKGLEWQAVAVVGLEDGTVPIAYARDAAAQAEERRLLYVALTRAASELWCSWAAAATGDGAGRARRPSPFLAQVRTALASDAPPAPERIAGHLAELRGRLVAAG